MSRVVRGGWVQEKTIGTGGFGTVILWRNEELDESLALKKCRVSSELTPKHKERWGKEIEIMLRLCHPNVINTVQVPAELSAPLDELPYLGMEYCVGGDLRRVLNKSGNCCGLPEYQVRALVHDVASGIEYLHSTRIIHRDLKPENIVLQIVDEKTVYKIIDLGYAKDLEEGSLCTSFVGTLQYLAPELFSSQRYTCTVDYWSFGILVFEAVTGFRPFLPNITPVKWHGEVKRKKDDDIYVYCDRRGDTQYSKNIPDPNHLCRLTKNFIEQWLRQILTWDARMRGGGLTETVSRSGPTQKRPRCFTMLDTILEMKIVFILNVASGEVLSYRVEEGKTLSKLQLVIEKETQTPVDEQELLLASGISPDPDKPAEQCWTEMGEEEWLVFLFRKNMTAYPATSRKVRPPPYRVVMMMKEPATLLPYQDQRSVWGHAVYFCSVVARDYRRLLQGQRAAMMSLLRGNSSFSKLKTRLETDFNRLQAQAEFFKDGLHFDITRYKEQAATGISSQKLTLEWKKMEEESVKFFSMKDEVLSLDQQCNVLSTRVVELQRSPFAKMKRIDVLEEGKTALGLSTIVSIKQQEVSPFVHKLMCQVPTEGPRRDQRHLVSDNMLMVQHVKRCQHDRERLTSELYLHLGKINQCKQELDGLNPKLDRLLEEMETAKERLRVLQRQRQSGMWTLLKMTLQQTSMRTSSQPSSILLTQTGASSDGGAAAGGAAGQVGGPPANDGGQVSGLSFSVSRSHEESVAVVTENVDVKSKLMELMGSLQDEHNRSMNELHSLDWSFMNDPSSAVTPQQQMYMTANQMYMYQPVPAAQQQLGLQSGSGASLQLYQPPQMYPQHQQQQGDAQTQYVLTPVVQGAGVSSNAAPGPTFPATQRSGSSGAPSAAAGRAGVAAATLQGSPGHPFAQGSPLHQACVQPKHLTKEQQAVLYTQLLSQTIGSGQRSATPTPLSTAMQGMNAAHLINTQGYQLVRPAAYSSAQSGLVNTQHYLTPVTNGRAMVGGIGAGGAGGYTQLTTMHRPHISVTVPSTKRTPPKVPTRSTSAAGSNA